MSEEILVSDGGTIVVMHISSPPSFFFMMEGEKIAIEHFKFRSNLDRINVIAAAHFKQILAP